MVGLAYRLVLDPVCIVASRDRARAQQPRRGRRRARRQSRGDAAGGRHRPAGRGQRGPPPASPGRTVTPTVIALTRGARAVDVDVRSRRVARSRLGAAVTWSEIEREPLRRHAAGAGRGGTHGRQPADPQRRHGRRQPRHLLAGRRRAPGARRRSTPRCDLDRRRRSSHAAGRRVHGRGQAHRAGTRAR